jgi:hypothetical protein
MTWPRSRGVQTAIGFVVALLSAVAVCLRIAMASFNHFYFAPHKAYPYPYSTLGAARWAMYLDCGLTFVGVFAIVYMVQRGLIAVRERAKSS